MSNKNGSRSSTPTSTSSCSSPSNRNKKSGGGGLLTKYFLVVLFLFGVLTLAVNTRVASVIIGDVSTLETYLEDSIKSFSDKIREDGIPNDDDTSGSNKKPMITHITQQTKQQEQRQQSQQQERPEQQQQKNQQPEQPEPLRNNKDYNPFDVERVDHLLSGLDCSKYGGPTKDIAEELVYWEDIPSDAKHVSPFKAIAGVEHTRYLTFEPDLGGWNNIRMGMETIMVCENIGWSCSECFLLAVLYSICHAWMCTIDRIFSPFPMNLTLLPYNYNADFKLLFSLFAFRH